MSNASTTTLNKTLKILRYLSTATNVMCVFISFSFASQITDLINVTKYHKAGFKGQGVKYAIFDGDGFDGWCNLRNQGVKIHPNPDGTVPDSDTDWEHGTSMIAAFYEIAPESEIYISRAWWVSDNDLAWLQREGITLVSQSQNDTSYAGGESFLSPNEDFERCVDQGMTVCIIAANNAKNTCGFHLTKDPGSTKMLFPDGKNYLDFTSSIDSVGLSIGFVRSGSQRPLSNYRFNITNITRGIQAVNMAVLPSIYTWNYYNTHTTAIDTTISIGDVLRLEIIQNADTVNYLDIITNSFMLNFPYDEDYKKYSASRTGLSRKIIQTGAILVSDYNKRDVISSISGRGLYLKMLMH